MATSTLGSGTLVLAGTTSGTTTVTATAVAGTTTLTLPAATDTLVGKATTDTLTNKTLTGAAMNGTVGATTPAAGAFTTLSATGVTTVQAGTEALPAITTTGDTNTGIFFPAADTIAFSEGGAEAMRIDSSGNVGIGTTTPSYRVDAVGAGLPANGIMRTSSNLTNSTTKYGYYTVGHYTNATVPFGFIQGESNSTQNNVHIGGGAGEITAATRIDFYTAANNSTTNGTERARIDSSGNFLVATTNTDVADANGVGASFSTNGNAQFSRASGGVVNINRKTDDGTLVFLQQDGSAEGSISVSGTTVSYNGGHLSRWSQLPNNQKDNTLLKGTIMSNLNDMCVWTKDGEILPNEQLNKMKVSDIDGDTNVAGVFVSWEFDEQCQCDDMNVAMTGDMIIRIAQGVTVVQGDLLMSAGDGTAKPQGDDICKSKTVAKVTSTYVTCTYEDGSYCVPCVLMAC